MEMIMAPDSRSMEDAGCRRVQEVPEPMYWAKLLSVVLAVSVIQIELLDCHTKPYGL